MLSKSLISMLKFYLLCHAIHELITPRADPIGSLAEELMLEFYQNTGNLRIFLLSFWVRFPGSKDNPNFYPN
jgi:hypothetical protein